LLQAAQIVSRHRRPAELFRELAPRLRAVVPFDFINFAIPSPSRNVMHLYVWDGGAWPHVPLEFKFDESAAGRVWQQQRVVAIPELLNETRFEPGLRWLRRYGLRSYWVFPLTSTHERTGALGFGCKRPHAFNSCDVEFLSRASELVGVCLDRTLSAEGVGEELEHLRLLDELDAIQRQALNLEGRIFSILGGVQQWAGGNSVGLYLFDPSSQSLRLHMRNPQFLERMAPTGEAPLEGTVAGQTFHHRQLAAFSHADLKQLPFDSVRRGLELGVKSLYMAPLLAGDWPMGILKIASHSDDALSRRGIERFSQAALAIAPLIEIGLSRITRCGTVRAESTSSPDHPPSTLAVAATGLESIEAPGQLLAAFFGSSTIGLCILDTELRFLAINKTLAEMNGISTEGHLGRTVREVLGDFARVVGPVMERVLATGQPLQSFEVSAMLPTRTELGHWIESYFPIRDATGRVKQLGVAVVEITEQRKLEQSLRGLTGTLQQEKKRQQILLEISSILATNLNVQQVFPRISASIRRTLRQEFAAYALQDEKSGMLVWQAKDFPLGKGKLVEVQVSSREGPSGMALREGKSMIFSSEGLWLNEGEHGAALRAEGIKSICCVPLPKPKGSHGVLCLASTRSDAFKPEDLSLLNQIAAQLAAALENQRTALEIEALKERLADEKQYLEGEVQPGKPFEEIVGESPALRQVLKQVETVAASSATVLILGETGTGKELVARALHRLSQRKSRNFVKLNCAAIPTGLLESELFGHEKGAFTGAISQKVGRLELADQGTLFLDEVGEIPLELQPKLLRVLQDHEFERLGSTRTIKVNLRLIAATNRDLARSVEDHEFRSDLFYRLNIFPIRMPALRERRSDVPLLVRYLVHKFSRAMNKHIETVPTETMNTLMNWRWPGNVRELENLIERSVILTEGPALHVPLEEFRVAPENGASHTLENAEREHIIRVLRETGGVLSGPTGAAHRLGLKRTTLQSKMQKLKITRTDYLGPVRE
jgi:formate hydrogenlyase transcriptional activator